MSNKEDKKSVMKVPERTGKAVWKFGYGSNMSQDFLREKKAMNPLDSCRTVLKGFSLSFPEGRGISFVEPSFATLKRDPDGMVHGVSTLLSIADAEKLDSQETTYDIEVCEVLRYEDKAESKTEDTATAGMVSFAVEVYVSRKKLPLNFPEGVCSDRYRDVLVRGAEENDLASLWIKKLQSLPIYNPSEATLAKRAAQASPSDLPSMTIAELALHNGDREDKPIYTSACGYIFELNPIFKSYRGRDVTFRNVLHRRGVNLDANDDGGKSPFPVLSKLPELELEYALRYRDRFISKSKRGEPIAVLEEFWQEQEEEFKGVFSRNTLSAL